jgi:hypothetical protein
LKSQARNARHEAIAEYAAEMAGSDADLDPELESAAVAHLIGIRRKPK